MSCTFALLHSPLVGPSIWAPASRALRGHGQATMVPALLDTSGSTAPFWSQHAASVARVLAALPSAEPPVILVAHSGAGPLLPAISAYSPHPIDGWIFVDAGLPHGGSSRLDEMAESAPDLATELAAELRAGGRVPTWTDEDLAEIVPDEGVRQALLAELQPRSLAFFEERIPPFAAHPRRAYLKLSAAYDGPAERARRDGCAYRELDGGHFHMVVDPESVALTLIELADEL